MRQPGDLTKYGALEFGFLFGIGLALAVAIIGALITILLFRTGILAR